MTASSSRSASSSAAMSGTARCGTRCASTGQRAAAGTKHVHASPSSTIRLPALRSPSRTSPSRSRPVRWRCDAARVSSCAVRGVTNG